MLVCPLRYKNGLTNCLKHKTLLASIVNKARYENFVIYFKVVKEWKIWKMVNKQESYN